MPYKVFFNIFIKKTKHVSEQHSKPFYKSPYLLLAHYLTTILSDYGNTQSDIVICHRLKVINYSWGSLDWYLKTFSTDMVLYSIHFTATPISTLQISKLLPISQYKQPLTIIIMLLGGTFTELHTYVYNTLVRLDQL